MSNVEFILPDGSHRIVAAQPGESIMQVAMNNKVPGIVAECGGNLSCATCHVHIAPEWAAKLKPVASDEADMLECAAEDPEPDSRLSCQLPMTPELDGIVVKIAKFQR